MKKLAEQKHSLNMISPLCNHMHMYICPARTVSHQVPGAGITVLVSPRVRAAHHSTRPVSVVFEGSALHDAPLVSQTHKPPLHHATKSRAWISVHAKALENLRCCILLLRHCSCWLTSSLLPTGTAILIGDTCEGRFDVRATSLPSKLAAS